METDALPALNAGNSVEAEHAEQSRALSCTNHHCSALNLQSSAKATHESGWSYHPCGMKLISFVISMSIGFLSFFSFWPSSRKS